MEKLHEIHEDGDYDLIVVDTPPTRHALDFLDAPRPADPPARQPHLPAADGADPGVVPGGQRRPCQPSSDTLSKVVGTEVVDDLVAVLPGVRRDGGGLPATGAEGDASSWPTGDTAFVLVTSPRPRRGGGGRVLRRQAAGVTPRRRRARRQPGPPRVRPAGSASRPGSGRSPLRTAAAPRRSGSPTSTTTWPTSTAWSERERDGAGRGWPPRSATCPPCWCRCCPIERVRRGQPGRRSGPTSFPAR